jgi:drug/metabolite transporter (DMT)-like permease
VAIVMGGAIGDASGTLLGNLLALSAGAAWAWYGVAISPLVQRVGAVRAASASLLIAGVILSPIAVAGLGAVRWGSISLGAWAGLGYSGILGLAVPTALWVRSVGRYGTQATMNYGYVEPVAAVAVAAVVLHETLGPIQALGSLLALVGVFLATGQTDSREMPAIAQLRD